LTERGEIALAVGKKNPFLSSIEANPWGAGMPCPEKAGLVCRFLPIDSDINWVENKKYWMINN
jgi:hypothetical protein